MMVPSDFLGQFGDAAARPDAVDDDEGVHEVVHAAHLQHPLESRHLVERNFRVARSDEAMSKRTPCPRFQMAVASLSRLSPREDNQKDRSETAPGSVYWKPSVESVDVRINFSNSLPYMDFSEPRVDSVCEPARHHHRQDPFPRKALAPKLERHVPEEAGGLKGIVPQALLKLPQVLGPFLSIRPQDVLKLLPRGPQHPAEQGPVVPRQPALHQTIMRHAGDIPGVDASLVQTDVGGKDSAVQQVDLRLVSISVALRTLTPQRTSAVICRRTGMPRLSAGPCCGCE